MFINIKMLQKIKYKNINNNQYITYPLSRYQKGDNNTNNNKLNNKLNNIYHR